MAGDWIPVRVDLTRTQEVITISRVTGRSRQEVAGYLLDLWSWFTSQSTGAALVDVALSDLTVALGADNDFWSAVAQSGWINTYVRNNREHISLPNYDRWLSRGAKQRFLARERMRRARTTADESDSYMRNKNEQKRTKASLHDMTLHDMTEKSVLNTHDSSSGRSIMKERVSGDARARKNSPNGSGVLPEHFELTEDMREWAQIKCAARIDVDLETERFLQVNRAKGTVFESWLSAWRAWMLLAKPKSSEDYYDQFK